MVVFGGTTVLAVQLPGGNSRSHAGIAGDTLVW
jgi:hypothetical protein